MKLVLPLDLDGFVAHVFSTKSKAGNEFFEVKFKILEAPYMAIIIMKQANQTITENYLRRLNQEREPVFLRNYQKHKRVIIFLTHPKKVLASVDFNYNEKHVKKVDFIRAQNLGIL